MVSTTRRRFLQLTGTTLAAPVPARLAWAQSWPTKPLRVIVPLTAGSASDVMARLVMEQVSAQLGQPVIVENRPGAGNTIGMGAVAKADPDGYTILVNSSTHTVTPATRSNLGFEMSDLAPIVPLGNMPVVMVFNPSKGYKQLSDFVAAAKAKPGSVNYASAGAGNSSHLNGERFRLAAGIRGGSSALQRRPRSDDRSDRRPCRLLFLSAGERASVPHGWLASGACSERFVARVGVAGRAHHCRSRLSELRIQFLGRGVRARQDAGRHPRQAVFRNSQGTFAPG